MQRIDTATRLVDANGAGRDGFTEGTPGVTAPTALSAAFFNSLQEEVARAIELLGGTLSGADLEQLGTLLVAALAAKVGDAGTVTDNAVVRFDGTGGVTIQNSGATVDDSANLITTGEYTYASAKSRTLFIPAEAAAIGDALGTPEWDLIDSPAEMAAQSRVDAGYLYFPLHMIPDGATITAVRAHVAPGVARATAGNRMTLDFRSRQSSAGGTVSTATSHGSATDDGTTSTQRISITSLSVSVSKSTGYAYVARLAAGNDGATNQDVFYGLWVEFDDLGPRNY